MPVAARVLYFDIDGTVLSLNTGQVKSGLAGAALETAVRRSRFDRLVCVGNVLTSLRMMADLDVDIDFHEVVLRLCHDAFTDEDWFRAHVDFVRDPGRRAAEIQFSADWWYMDDLAEHYFETEGMRQDFEEHRGHRILVPEPDGDGEDVLAWLERVHS